MEGFDKKQEREQMSLVERKRHEALTTVLDQLEERLRADLKDSFASYGKEYVLTCREDCMVAYAQQMREDVEALYTDIRTRDDYREEQAIVKLLRLFEAYERMVALYAELLSYYPEAARRIEKHLPSLPQTAKHADELWEKVQKQ